jgi:hypothetical protein
MNIILNQFRAANSLPVTAGQTRSSANNTVAENSAEKDAVEISNTAKFLSGTGLDLSASSASYIQDTLKYDLSFNSSESATLNASGIYYKKEKSFSMNLSFQFQQEVEIDGVKSLKTFQANLNFNASFTKELSANKYTNKEDIGKFIRKIVKQITDTLSDKKQNLLGVIIDKEDWKEIAGMEDGKLAKILSEIINMAILTERMKRMAEKEEDSENIILKPEREKESGVEINDNTVSISDLSLEITEVDPAESSSEEPSVKESEPSTSE